MCALLDQSTQTVSLRLSEVLGDIGVNEEMVRKRRRSWLLMETMDTVTDKLQDKDRDHFHFGSQTEATTTFGLQSDVDELVCFNYVNVIQEWRDWELGKLNLLFVQDEMTAPGYCVLQQLRPDVPVPVDDNYNEYTVKDKRGRILFKNTGCHNIMPEMTTNGPAETLEEEGFMSSDSVTALPCKSWPPEGMDWLNRQCNGDWPTEELKRTCGETGFFVVPVGSRDSEEEETEWRVSTSMAERYLMFSLNITQLSCYILLKMILKTFIHPMFEENPLSSFMCKTVVLHCVARTKSDFWKQCNLLTCLTFCLHMFQAFVQCGNCPHFIIPGNNLMRGKFSHVKKRRLDDKLRTLMENLRQALLEIEIDGLGDRLQMKFNMLPRVIENLPTARDTKMYISQWLAIGCALIISAKHELLLKDVAGYRADDVISILATYVQRLANYSVSGNRLIKSSCSLLVPQISTTLGSVLASVGIQHRNTIPREALTWFSLGVNSDVSSSRLKLASVFYCVGDLETTEVLLRNVEQRYNTDVVEPVCSCISLRRPFFKKGFARMSMEGSEEKVKEISAFCVRFLPCESNCVPVELQYEMHRSSREDLFYRGRSDYWMDWAMVDSLPYLYFLQYKTYSQLDRFEERQLALANLTMATCGEMYPGYCGEVFLGHRETALNLLGQCMEQENRPQDALQCYVRSLNIHARNNAAKWHVCKLLARFLNNRVQ